MNESSSLYDSIADSYDAIMEEGCLTKIIRNYFHQKIKESFSAGDLILDLGAGTGIDAMFAASLGIRVIAVELSSGMIEVGKKRIAENKQEQLIDYKQMSVDDLTSLTGQKFDGVISDFNCLNYVKKMDQFALQLSKIVKPNAKCMFTVLNPVSISEVFYLISKLRLKLAFNKINRRGKTFHVPLKLYYSNDFFDPFSSHFELRNVTGFGTLIPPDPMNKILNKIPGVKRFLLKQEFKWKNQKLFCRFSDHYIIEMRYNGVT